MTWIIPRKKQTSLTFDDLFDRFFDHRDISGGSFQLAPVDVESDDGNVYVSAEVPGVEKKDLSIEFHDGVLTISGEKKSERVEDEKGVHYKEISRGEFVRRINVGDVEFDKAKAEYKDGILKVQLPKSHAGKPKRLSLS